MLSSSSSEKPLFRYRPRAAATEDQRREQSHLEFKWMFSPKRLTDDEKITLYTQFWYSSII